MTQAKPSAAEVAAAISLAAHAPSVHNTQPWRWHSADAGLDLFADRTRRLQAADPFGRLLLLSCGAALHHMTVAMAARGWRADITRFPSPRDLSLLASATFEPASADKTTLETADAILARRTDRRPLSSWEVPPAQVRRLIELAADHGAFAQQLSDDQRALWATLARRAESALSRHPEYTEELGRWTNRPGTDTEGIPASHLPAQQPDDPEAAGHNRFPLGELAGRGSPDQRACPVSLLLTTSSDDPLARLRAGEALSVVLLEATRLGLATKIDSLVVEDGETRDLVEQEMLHGSKSPQVLVTVGWSSSADSLPPTPRRDVSEILDAP